MIEFVVQTIPVAKGRPRVAVVNGRARGYTPKRTANAEAGIRQSVAAQLPHGWTPMTGPLSLDLTVWLSPPASAPKRDHGIALPFRRPDLDNYVKTLADALDQLVWKDDAQVVDIAARKRYAWDGQPPRWVVRVGVAMLSVAEVKALTV